ncbi:trypsin-like peptidase domain-containing protein [Streptomyces sp. NPDC058155]|uniref:caspase, EACC1-associated type n=1 Tax=Streptomyces sp. NPDC058155 TaxID=3346359 RepID=UPI0036E190BF
MTDALSEADTSNVVLIGCYGFTALEDLPAVRDNLIRLREVLTDVGVWGVPGDRVEVLDQPSGEGQVVAAVKRAAAEASDTLVVYYAGHGLLDPEDSNDLYLALPESRKDDHHIDSAIRYDTLKRYIRSSRARRKVVLLDCCYSARAIAGGMGSGAANLVHKADVDGTCLIAAARETALALAVPGEKYTAFTGVLLEFLERGVEGPQELLSMSMLYDAMRSRLIGASRPEPQMNSRNAAAQICIARNRGYVPERPPPLPARRERRSDAKPLGPDPMSDLKSSLVRVLSVTGEVVGGGFLISSDVVCTCAYVVQYALGVPPHTEPLPDTHVDLDFPLLDGRPRVRAAVTSWHDGEEKNVALLRLGAQVLGTRPVPMVDESGVWGHLCRTFGYPAGSEHGQWAAGVLRALQGSGLLQMEVNASGTTFGPGYSGAPVWDELLGGVVGMVVAAERRGHTVYLLPSADLVDSLALRPPCPFPGLAAFSESQGELFQGREADIDRVYATVSRQPSTLVVGPSGSGKTSLLWAAVLPLLRADGLGVTPVQLAGTPPAVALARTLADVLRLRPGRAERLHSAEELKSLLEADGDVSADLHDRFLDRLDGTGHVLFVDQLEAECTGQDPEPVRHLFRLLDRLFEADRDNVLKVVAAGRPEVLDVLQPSGPPTVQFLAPLNANDLKQAITAPLTTVPALRFEPGLPDRILADAGEAPGRMSLVQLVLTELWDRRTPSTLTHDAYNSCGGVAGAFAVHAEKVFLLLPEDQSERVRRLLVHLTRPGDGETFVCRPVRTAELAPELVVTARMLAGARLVVLSRPSGSAGQEDEIVELAHEALTRQWPRLKEWLSESREARLWHESLRTQRERWELQQCDPAHLLRGPELAEAHRRLAADPGSVSANELDYILRSGRRVRRRACWRMTAFWMLAVLAAAAGAAVLKLVI